MNLMKMTRGEIGKMMTKKDILEALGIETRSEDRFWSGLFLGLGCGALVGGIAALLFAPKSGTELREAIGDKKREIVNKLRNRANEMRDTELGSEGMPGGYKPSV